LEKIFFEEKIYQELEKKHLNWEKVIDAIDKAFEPFKKKFKKQLQTSPSKKPKSFMMQSDMHLQAAWVKSPKLILTMFRPAHF